MDKQRVARLARQKRDLDQHILDLEEMLSEARAKRWAIQTRELPQLLMEEGLREAVLEDGTEVKIADEVEGNIPKDPERAAQALKWLRENGYGDLIKNQVLATFARGEDEAADRYAQQLVKEGFTCEKKEGVHPQTLLSWARKELQAGNPIELEGLGLRQVTIAKVKAPKAQP